MRPQDQRTADALKQRLIEAGVPVVEVWAFGSRVRGDYDEESDLDLLVVLQERNRAVDEDINRMAWEVGAEAGYVVSTILRTVEQLTSFPFRASGLLDDIRREGIRV